MDIVNKIKRLFSKEPNNDEVDDASSSPSFWTSDLAADVTFYPDKIIVQTFDFTDGPSIGSTKFTILSVDTGPDILGQTLRKHFNLTEHGLEFKANNDAWNAFKKAAGFKTNKATYQDARNITCRQTTNEIVLTPSENTYNTGFDHRPDLNIILPLNSSDLELGIQLSKARDLSNG
jgi:hypothetical protein